MSDTRDDQQNFKSSLQKNSNIFVQNKFKRLAIISDCVHMFDENGNAVTENHIYCRQIQALASKFEHTVICCPFAPFTKQSVVSAYTSGYIDFIPVPNVGGNSFKDKIALLKTIPVWIKAFSKANAQSDIVYMRYPNNLSIPGFFYFRFKRAKTFAQYTGTWKNYSSEPLTYRFQKWLLTNFFKGPVWVYTDEKKPGKNIYQGSSPSYTLEEWDEETEQVKKRIENLQKGALQHAVFVTVGALVANKNQQFILDAFKLLHEKDFSFHLYLVGDGPLMKQFNDFIVQNNLQEHITLTGKKTYTALRVLYRDADFLVQAPLAEGYGKVPIEGFFHGVIPFLSNAALAEEMIGNSKRGFIFSIANPQNLAEIICNSVRNTDLLPAMVENGRNYAKSFTLENWVNGYCKTINEYFD